MPLVARPRYLDQIVPFVDAPVVKVLTGLRRSGKSQLLALVIRLLADRGVPGERICHLDFDSLDNAHLTTAAALHEHITAVLPDDGRVYVLLDEVQEVDEWERVVNSLQATGRVDVYLTGSNSHLLSSELATYIAGRYVSIDVMPLSFAEHLDFAAQLAGRDPTRTAEEFERYVRLGGFPGTHVASYSEREVRVLVQDIYRSTLIRDVLTRHQIRDADMFERVAAFALDNVGNPFSARRVAAFMKSQNRQVNHQTVAGYLNALAEAFVLVKVPRFDVRGRALLAMDEKYYVGDHGLVHALFGYSDQRLPGVLENIVYAELVRRGYTVTIGKVDTLEVDFVDERSNERCYVQVTVTAADPQTRRRELAPLQKIADSYPKFLLSLDPMAGGNTDGIRHQRIPDFLLSDRV